MTNDEGSTNPQMTKPRSEASSHSDLVIPSGFDIRHSSFGNYVIASAAGVAELVSLLEPHPRVAIDTEADSLHCYKEKLCLLQISVPARDAIVDPLANVDLSPLTSA